MRGTFRTKILAVVFLGLAIFTGYILPQRLNRGTREVVRVPVLTKNILPGQLIKENNVRMTEVGKYNLPGGIIRDKEQIIGKYALKELNQDRFIYKNDLVSQEPRISIPYRINNGGVAFKTDLAKCAGGIPKPGDFVKIYIVIRNEETRLMQSILYPDLRQVEILDIQNIKGETVLKNEGDGGGFSPESRDSTPAYVTVNTLTDRQEEEIISGYYNGEIHLALINPEKVDTRMMVSNPPGWDASDNEISDTLPGYHLGETSIPTDGASDSQQYFEDNEDALQADWIEEGFDIQ